MNDNLAGFKQGGFVGWITMFLCMVNLDIPCLCALRGSLVDFLR